MRLSIRRLVWTIISLYSLFTLYAVYYVFIKKIPEHSEKGLAKYESAVRKNDLWSPWTPLSSVRLSSLVKKLNLPPGEHEHKRTVHIWGKAAIGQYLWQHIFNGDLEDDGQGGLLQSGTAVHGGIEFRYLTGPGLIPSTAPDDVTNLVLVLNGREPDKIDTAKTWLDFLPKFPSLRHVAMVLLGNEQCENKWVEPYMKENKGILDLVFLVYDSIDVDGKHVYQWPLGVATYRNFPINPDVDVSASRHYSCNFAGTVYEDSSRESMMKILEHPEIKERCLVEPRYKWEQKETESSMGVYVDFLTKSDLTLCPVGMNAECYRIYEAMSMGSVPVIEDQSTAGLCSSDPLRLLREFNAPVIYIKTWDELPDLLEKEAAMSEEAKISRRKVIVRWYQWFRLQLRERFVMLLDQIFFD